MLNCVIPATEANVIHFVSLKNNNITYGWCMWQCGSGSVSNKMFQHFRYRDTCAMRLTCKTVPLSSITFHHLICNMHYAHCKSWPNWIKTSSSRNHKYSTSNSALMRIGRIQLKRVRALNVASCKHCLCLWTFSFSFRFCFHIPSASNIRESLFA